MEDEEIEEMSEKKTGDIILGIMFIIFLTVCIIANFIIADKDKSEEENRSLAQKPKLNKEEILSGGFMEKYESYLSDQFVGRNTLREFNIFLKIMGGSREEEGIFLGEDGQLLKDIAKPDMGVLLENIASINSLLSDETEGENQLKVYMMLVPDSTEIYSELLPKFAEVESEKKLFGIVKDNLSDDIIWIDGLSVMSKYKSEKLYYKTDHHWTTLGAYHMFCDCMDILGIGYDKDAEDGQVGEADDESGNETGDEANDEPKNETGDEADEEPGNETGDETNDEPGNETGVVADGESGEETDGKPENEADSGLVSEPEYDVYPVTTEFNGMLSANSGFCPNEREEIDVYIPKGGAASVIVNYVDEQKRTTSLYDLSMLKEKDQYSIFLGGNSSLIDIRTNCATDKKILIIKDSFANSFIPFMVQYYSEIVVVDPRYYAGTMKDVMETYEVNEILFLYSGNTFLSDNNIEGFIDN